jgi:hypothetical protein
VVDVTDAPLSKLTLVDPRTVWAHEAHDFTPWLLAHADHLADVLGIELELTANEHPVGGFSLDLIGQDLTNDCTLIVENQLATTDHSHLGQLITYAAGTDAATVVWMATQFREEHRQALDFLNEIAGDDARFFGIEINVVRIDDSAPAPLFRLAAEPNDWHAQFASATKAAQRTGGKGPLYLQFWHAFLEEAAARSVPWYRPRKPQPSNWLDVLYIKTGVRLSVSFGQGGSLRSELYIDTGDAEENLALFSGLRGRSEEIEAAFGGALDWQELPNRRACRIAWHGVGEVTNEEQHAAYINDLIEHTTRLHAAIPVGLVTELMSPLADSSTGGDGAAPHPIAAPEPPSQA